jgi:hypothetical protein
VCIATLIQQPSGQLQRQHSYAETPSIEEDKSKAKIKRENGELPLIKL